MKLLMGLEVVVGGMWGVWLCKWEMEDEKSFSLVRLLKETNII
jgi:hypothetical protein